MERSRSYMKSFIPCALAARFVVGIGTATMTPVIMAYIVTRFPQNQVAKGFFLYMLISGASVIFGPTLSGLVISGHVEPSFLTCLSANSRLDNRNAMYYNKFRHLTF